VSLIKMSQTHLTLCLFACIQQLCIPSTHEVVALPPILLFPCLRGISSNPAGARSCAAAAATASRGPGGALASGAWPAKSGWRAGGCGPDNSSPPLAQSSVHRRRVVRLHSPTGEGRRRRRERVCVCHGHGLRCQRRRWPCSSSCSRGQLDATAAVAASRSARVPTSTRRRRRTHVQHRAPPLAACGLLLAVRGRRARQHHGRLLWRAHGRSSDRRSPWRCCCRARRGESPWWRTRGRRPAWRSGSSARQAPQPRLSARRRR
jgi:hypothetical protein